jgi:3D-(3,5/4)-trihydroxycyclohexane-1,2-dione acylhydrolase (decyclizing)
VEPGPDSITDLKAAVKAAKAHQGGPVLIHINNDPLIYAPDGEGWWDVPVMPISELESTQKAYQGYAAAKKTQKLLLGKGAVERNN